MNPNSDSTTDRMVYSDGSVVPHRGLPAWLLSLILHSVLMGAMFLMMMRISNGSGQVENKTGGIVLVDATSETTEYLDEGDVKEATAQESQPSPAALPSAEELPPDLPGLQASDTPLTGVGNALMESLTGAQSLVAGTSNNRPLGGKVTTEVFGVKGTGTRFVYVFDRSASMEDLGGKPLRAAKKQLLASLASLGENQQFQIVFYNDRTKIFRPEPGQSQLSFATEDSKRRATSFVASIRGESGTDHLAALKKALAFGPDVVFLLTDAEGGFSATDLLAVSDWNRSGAVINAIEFGIGRRAGDPSLKAVARQSLGQYIYKDVRSFRD